ncbi:MAG: hypothetical protein Q8O92_15045 [Candidatus Latescibacter sp.]|nr:hypothetical protein [Candidatus Latescibacter sp.]
MRRRTFSKKIMAGSALGFTGYTMPIGSYAEKVLQPKQKPYGEQYFDWAAKVWERQATSELPIIGQAADKATETIKNGKKLYSQAMLGHMLTTELRKDRPGNPGYLDTWRWSATDEMYASIGKGDFLLFDWTKKRVKDAHDRGAFTVGVRVPYVPNKTTPKGVLSQTNQLLFTDGLLTEDCSDLVLTSGVPFTSGVLSYPEIPSVRAFPLCVQGVGIFYWMLTAEIAARVRGGAAMGSTDRALEYVNLICKRGKKILADLGHIDEAAKAMVEYVRGGGRYWNYSYGCEMDAENEQRASGLPMSQGISPGSYKDRLKPGHFVIISGEHSDVKENYEMALAVKAVGAKVINIGPARTEGSTGKDLSKIADWHIETYSPEREGALSVSGFDKKICPTTGILFALALWITNAQFVARMIEADMTPGFDMGGHLIGGSAYDKDVRAIVDKRGY